ncbi:MAG: hypothetical protein R3A48_25380 [Polyangiales bacterium]
MARYETARAARSLELRVGIAAHHRAGLATAAAVTARYTPRVPAPRT